MARCTLMQEAEIRRKLFEEVEKEVKQVTKRWDETSKSVRRMRRSEANVAVLAKERPRPALVRTDSADEVASPLSTPRSRREVLSRCHSASLANIGWEGATLLSPSMRLQEACRFHAPAPGSPRCQATPHQVSATVKDELRFFSESSPHRRLLQDILVPPAAGMTVPAAAAGLVSAQCRRYDTPDSVSVQLGRTRSSTPDWHVRHGRNLTGASLPGAPAAPEAVSPPTSPKSTNRTQSCSPLRGQPLVPRHSNRASEEAVRFHYDQDQVRKSRRLGPGLQAFSMSNLPSGLLASPRPSRLTKPWR